MIDSGATTNFIDPRFATLHSLPLTSKPLTETLLLADGKTQVIISKEVQLSVMGMDAREASVMGKDAREAG